LSVLTPKKIRRNWEIADVAKAMGMQSLDITDCPWSLLHHLSELDMNKPLFVNCRVCRERWHVGAGSDGPRAWERNVIVRNQLLDKGWEKDVVGLEQRVNEKMRAIWDV
jgi:hypothetical protein